MEFRNKRLNFNEINEIIDNLSKLVCANNKKSLCIALIGDLGTGKTAFTKRLLKGLGIEENVKSPTFTYMIDYKTKDMNIYHFDLYRVSNEDDLYNIGYFDYIDQKGLVILEWADLIKGNVPENALYFEIKHDDIDSRYISIYIMKDGEKRYVDISTYNFD
ncbi:tRNA (adenosine(37)-N6)-threonylcarbamoyltransferase complex ATPase subunit type 1 TsaE [Caviibacter abscessus]|uniref:tRNA (adenosine(37)-N6)-threonylcarbamoyltransferase complex ATPase subunit type 1 TsaE n=1 Tax=Caviibacter abscessus TaxID=1766719 RepID=UPI00082E7D07|nr:tRNA (adenosine(37)-N6)-threonylcarbamoyltransferase complex ATPase subunit type 1 TsaE [Caviibacter abscessus]